MKKKLLAALSIAVALTLVPVGGPLVASAGVLDNEFFPFDREQHLEMSVSGNDGDVSGNEGSSNSNGNGNVNGSNSGTNQNVNKDERPDKQHTTGDKVTVTTSDGNQVVTSMPTSNSSSVQSVAVITPKDKFNEVAGLTQEQTSAGQYLAVVVANSQCGENAKKTINDVAMSVSAKLATILEIDLGIFISSGEQIGKVTDLTSPIQFVIATPSDIPNPAMYDFAMIHIHNGQARVLPDMDTDPATITVETDGFSVYAVVYGEPGSFDAFRTAGVKDSVPKTGAELPFVFPVAVAGVALATTAVVVWKKKRED